MPDVWPSIHFGPALLEAGQRMARLGSWAFDLVEQRLEASPELERILGETTRTLEQRGYPGFLTDLAAPEDVDQLRSVLREAAAGDQIALEVRMSRPDGSVYHASVRAELTERPGGVVARGWLQDITERRRADETIARAHATAEVAAREHQIAAELQRSLLPGSGFEVEHLSIATFYRPGQEGAEVGGDWFDVIGLADGRTALVMGDVMGHGVHAAAVMGQLRTAVRAYARIGMPARRVMESVDQLMLELFPEQIATCLYAEFDPRSLTVHLVTAGHVPPLVRGRGGRTRRLEVTSHPPFGLGRPFPEPATSTLAPGDVLVLYTDGLVERRDRDVEEGIELLRDTVSVLTAPLGMLPGRLTAELLPDGPEDDVALLLAEVAT